MTRMIPLGEIAAKTKTSEPELNMLLSQLKIRPADGMLTPEQVDTLIEGLTQRQAKEEGYAQERLVRMVKDSAVLIDTSSILEKTFPDLMDHLVPYLRQNGKQLFVPSSTVAEMQGKFLRNPALQKRVNKAFQRLAALRKEGVVAVCGKPGERFADKQLLTVATDLLTTTKLLILTQDNKLSEDLMHLNRLHSVYGKRLTVARINRYGYLSRYAPRDQRFAGGSAAGGWGRQTQVIPENQTLLPIDRVPTTGEMIQTQRETFLLGKRLANGGEGTIYDLGDGTVAKLYHKNKLTIGRQDKLLEMVKTPVTCPGVCWPKELLWDMSGAFVGYRMEKARGVELQRALFTRPALEQHFPDWEKKDMVKLCVTILEKICALHQLGILLGDINPLNILVVSAEEVWFVDCDSYQIGGYPCPVGTVRFTAPEIQKRNFSTFLRTPGHEAFAVATLLFMIMLPGKSPYAQEGSDDLSEAIRTMNFPYPCGEKHGKNMPMGAWRYLWSHLPRFLKEDFYDTFQCGEKHSTERSRLTPQRWLAEFRRYLHILEKADSEQDPESAKIFPSRWKISDPKDRVVYRQQICMECWEPFDILKGEYKRLHAEHKPLPRRCPKCSSLWWGRKKAEAMN